MFHIKKSNEADKYIRHDTRSAINKQTTNEIVEAKVFQTQTDAFKFLKDLIAADLTVPWNVVDQHGAIVIDLKPDQRKVFAVPLYIYATAYVVADNESQAALYVSAAGRNATLNVLEDIQGTEDDKDKIVISEKGYDDLDLPKISISPAMTIGDIESIENISQVYPDEAG